jgi:hypothetical protein
MSEFGKGEQPAARQVEKSSTGTNSDREKSPLRAAAVGTVKVACQLRWTGSMFMTAAPPSEVATTEKGLAFGRMSKLAVKRAAISITEEKIGPAVGAPPSN